MSMHYRLILSMKQLGWCQSADYEPAIIKVPLQFTFPPVEALSKELTKLNSPHPYRICYLGPRWDNSVVFHKKYSGHGGYEFKERRVSKNNSFLQDSMTHNQFYKNEIYYRAFEGMNPTLGNGAEVTFESRFESGNLDCVVRVGEGEYDLFLRIDANTRGHLDWYYFAVRGRAGQRVKLNLCNLTKSDTHYSRGLNPYLFSARTQQWTNQPLPNLNFRQKKLRYEFLYQRMKIRNFFELSFDIDFQDDQEIRLAYSIPYTYSNLLAELKLLSGEAEVGVLGQTLTGVNIPIVMIGKHQEGTCKPVVLVTGRVHPAQTNSSVVASSLLKYLCHSAQARYLREKVLIVVIPMLNADGVILGNSRGGAAGRDLNRCFKTKTLAIFPEVALIKRLVDRIGQTHEVELYLDLHGHSRKKNVFAFGPPYTIAQPEYYKCRVFPKLLSNTTPIFRYYSCTYDIPYEKRATARAVMLSQLQLSYVYTLECSLGFYHDYTQHRDVPFTRKKWEEFGQHVVTALKEYFEGQEQYEAYLQTKRKAKKALIEDIKISSGSPLLGSLKKKQIRKEETKDIKLFKIFQQIREMQEKKGRQQRKQKDSDNDSDSNNQQEELQKEKMYEFTGMVVEFVQQEAKRAQIMEKEPEKQRHEKQQKEEQQRKKNKLQMKKKKELRLKEEDLFSHQTDDSKLRPKRPEVKTQSKNRNPLREEKPLRLERKDVISEELRKPPPPLKEDFNNERTRLLSSHQYMEEQMDFISVQKRANSKMNVRMFNFSKMVQNPKSLRYQDTKESRARDGSKAKCKDESSSIISQSFYRNKPNYVNLQHIEEGEEERSGRQTKERKQNTDELKHIKGRIGFPPSFYRIKYHNNQRKKQQNSRKERQLQDYEQYQKIAQQHHLNSLTTLAQRDGHQPSTELDKKEGFVLKARKFPVL